MEEYESLPAFLEHVSLVMDNDEVRSADRVTIMTIHAAKGLEFDRVYLPGWEEGIFPSQRALDEGGLKSLEEERRLAYVAITRARATAPSSTPPTAASTASGRALPQPLRRRTPGCAHRGANHDDRRREPVASAVERAHRPVRPPRPGPVDAGQHPQSGWQRATAPATTPSRSASSKPAARPSRSARRRAPTSRSASACSTASSATARSPRSRATSSRSTSSTQAARRCSTASSARPERPAPRNCR